MTKVGRRVIEDDVAYQTRVFTSTRKHTRASVHTHVHPTHMKMENKGVGEEYK